MFLEVADERWPESSQASLARRLLADYLRLGPIRFVTNADVELLVWRAGDQVLPVVYRTCVRTNRTAEVCSPWNHYVRYPLAEFDRHGSGIAARCGRVLLLLSIPFLRMTRIDEVVSVNNWLLSTNPSAFVERAALEHMTAALCRQFPQRAILFRTVNQESNAALASNLIACGYRLVANRTVYLLDPASREYRVSKNANRDRKLLHNGDYELLAHGDLGAADMPRLAELYRLLYIEKHNELNAEFSPLFFEIAWRNRLFEFRALRKRGRIDAYVAFLELDGVLIATQLGYDVRLPEDLGLYRRAVALLMEESRRRGLRMNFSAGAGAFKHHRGAQPCVEYDAVFDRHLPLRRRAGWRLLEAAGLMQHRKVRRGW